MDPGRIGALLGYVAILVVMLVGAWLLSLAAGSGRVSIFVLGVLVGGLWAVRSRIPMLDASDGRLALAGWVGLMLTGVIALSTTPPRAVAAPFEAVMSLMPAPRGERIGLRPAPSPAAARQAAASPTVRATSAPPDAAPPPRAGVPSAATASGPSPSPAPSPRAVGVPAPTLPAGFDATRYLGQGNAYDCSDFLSQAEAQAVLRADPSDPNVLDQGRNGIACDSSPPPRDTRRVPRSGP